MVDLEASASQVIHRLLERPDDSIEALGQKTGDEGQAVALGRARLRSGRG